MVLVDPVWPADAPASAPSSRAAGSKNERSPSSRCKRSTIWPSPNLPRFNASSPAQSRSPLPVLPPTTAFASQCPPDQGWPHHRRRTGGFIDPLFQHRRSRRDVRRISRRQHHRRQARYRQPETRGFHGVERRQSEKARSFSWAACRRFIAGRSRRTCSPTIRHPALLRRAITSMLCAGDVHSPATERWARENAARVFRPLTLKRPPRSSALVQAS